MSNWLDDFKEDNTIEKNIIIQLNDLIADYPEEKITIEESISILNREPVSDELLFKIRDNLKHIITKDERNLIRKKDKISKVIKSISSYKINQNNEGLYDFQDCFFDDFDFQIGENFYYLRFPSLHEKVDGNTKTELMLDRYIKDFLKNSLSDYQLGRNNFEQFEEFSLIIIHHLTPQNASNIDTDNIEIKKPIDAINKILIKNDTANYSDIFQIVDAHSEVEFTEMYVIKGHELSKSILRLLST